MLISLAPRFPILVMQQTRSSDSNPRRGFGNKEDNKANKAGNSSNRKGRVSQPRKPIPKQSSTVPTQAPAVTSRYDENSYNTSLDPSFEKRLEAVKRSALEKKKADNKKEFGAIDYDAPVEPEEKTIGLGTKIGIGVAVLVFGLVFALGDFLPSGSISPVEDSEVVDNKLSKEEESNLQNMLKEYEVTLRSNPKDPTAMEGAAVTSAELGKYAEAASLLEDLIKVKSDDSDIFRLLGEVKYKLKDYDGSIAAYKSATRISEDVNFEVLRGLTNALLAAGKPDEAVQFLLDSRERLKSVPLGSMAEGEEMKTKLPIDPVQVELLLGKAYSDWGHVSDAVSVYDQLITSHPNDFRGYLAKGIILKENGSAGDAERMFIQARFFAPENAKMLVNRYSR
ncbi:uncharacterized protein LOC111457503 isoform X1 [Cucurbita moschata]|uniref:Uncharacterized protein LOC111457503 isoform X1 n=1 Tax=Cucurbita moschata TaxID=3662 RepID=A0A6J1GWF7_CUCMO|nr:uncharacterized protein LOC111457503 isoform X1 [Cucurbita moschata]